jgi:DNA repair protein RadC
MSKAYLVTSKIVLVKEKGALYDINKTIGNQEDAYNAIKTVTGIQQEAQEVFGIICLNNKNSILSICEISRGSVDATIVHPREIFKAALLYNAMSIILFHNHPSGSPTPSTVDINTTKRCVDAGNILGINVLDHIIIGDDCYTSLKYICPSIFKNNKEVTKCYN